MVNVSILSPSLSPRIEVAFTHCPLMHFQYWCPVGMLEGSVMVMVTVEPGEILVIVKREEAVGEAEA